MAAGCYPFQNSLQVWEEAPGRRREAAVGRSQVKHECVSFETRPAALRGPALPDELVSLGKSLYGFKAKLPWLRSRAGNRLPRGARG